MFNENPALFEVYMYLQLKQSATWSFFIYAFCASTIWSKNSIKSSKKKGLGRGLSALFGDQQEKEESKIVKKDQTSKVNTSPELVKFLRENKIPFKAASTKGTNAAAMVARSSIILIYMFFSFFIVNIRRFLNIGILHFTP